MPLSASTSASEWIRHFVHSGNKKFRGKSKKQRIQMALAAYYAAGGRDAISDMQYEETLVLDAKAIKITADGYLIAAPRIARTGIQVYSGVEMGDERDELRIYRPEAEVFHVDAMTSLAHKPVTLDHPPENVNAKNWKKYAVGKIEGEVARDGTFIRVPLILMDAEAIDAVKSGKKELSVGYSALLKWGSGRTDDDEEYDAIQTGIRANHVALVDKARGGPKLVIGDIAPDDDDLNDEGRKCPDCDENGKLPNGEDCPKCDGEGYLYDEDDREFSGKQRKEAASKGQAMKHGGFPIKNAQDLRNAIRAVGRAKNPAAAKAHIKRRARALGLTKLLPESWRDEQETNMTTKLIDGVSIELDEKDAQILERHLNQLTTASTEDKAAVEKLKEQIAALQEKLSEAKKVGDTKDGEIVMLKKQVDDAKLTDEVVDQKIEEKLDTITRALPILGDSYDPKGKSVAQIKRDVVTSAIGDAAKAMSDEAVSGAFIHATAKTSTSGINRLASSFSGALPMGDQSKAVAAYDARTKRLQDAYKRKTA